MVSSSSEFDPTLLQAISQRRLVPFVGAGVSVGVNKPRAKTRFLTWTELLLRLADAVETLDPTGADRIRITIKDGDLLAAADVALNKLGKTRFSDCVVEAIAFPDSSAFDLSLPKAIWNLNPNLVVTTNYDRVLEWSAERRDPQIVLNHSHAELRQIFNAVTRPSIWHLHGHMDHKQSLILSPSQYKLLYSSSRSKPNEAAVDMLRQLFSQHPILFIGFSMTDSYVLDAIEKAVSVFSGYTGPRWALLKKGDTRTEELWGEFDVKVYHYEEHGQPLIDRIDQMAAAAAELGKKSRQTTRAKSRTQRKPSGNAPGAELIQQADTQAMLDRWKRARKGDALEGEPHRLDVFVEPRISVWLQKLEADNGRSEEKWETLPAGVQTLLDQHFVPSDRWLVITEDAGGGKTVLSWLLAAELSRREERFWVVRYEGRFPEDLRKDLETRLQGKLDQAAVTQTATEVLNDLLAQRRVVVIYDALDQDNSSAAVDRIHTLRHATPDDRLKTGLRLIVTSRPYAVNQHHTRVFHLQDWRHCRLELFDAGQQADYRQQVVQLAEAGSPGSGAVVQAAYQQLLPDPEAVADLLVYPVVQAQIRSLVELQLSAKAKGTPRPFRNAGDLYLEVANRLLDRAFLSWRYTETLKDRAELFQLLACYGYLMMLKYRDYRVPEHEIAAMHAAVQDRCEVNDKDWERYEQILQDTSLTEHLLLNENGERELSFPSLKMAEFFAGLYLGRYCDERVIKELQPEIGRDEWNNVWRFVAELPETTNSSGQPACEPDSLCFSLQALFAVPDEGKVRPTESMFRAWQVLQRKETLKDVREQVLGGWRQQFRRILIEGYERGQPTERALRAAEVLFEGDLETFVKAAVKGEMQACKPRLQALRQDDLKDHDQEAEQEFLEQKWRALRNTSISQWCLLLRPDPDLKTYALCSNAKTGDPDNLTFMMGASETDKDAYADEKPWQEVSVPAFYMATACVTKTQYALFDPQRGKERSDFNEKSPDPDCPMISVNFHDGICFALWLDDRYSLPSEVQWEGAAWGGLDRRKHQDYVIGVPPYTAAFTSAEVNFDGNYPLQEPESEYRGRTVPVRGGGFQPNGFGLWHMRGNVREYTRSEWHESPPDAIKHETSDLAHGSAAAVRCVRGGSWFPAAGSSRCSYRLGDEYRSSDTGFRLSRTK